MLDPACGSGTFLFYLAKVVEGRIRQAHPLLEEHTRQICAHMVVGMDVHPIAVEMAQATLATALPPGPTRPFLQVFLADSMLAHRAARIRLDETMRLPTTKPDGELLIPQELVESPHAAQLIDQLVEAATAAAEGKEDPQSEYPELPGELLDQLTEVVRTEGDHVWKWYIGNNVAPIRLASGAAAIIGNPPWLVVNDTPEGTRKAQIAELAADYRLRPRNTGSARGDLAALFSARVVDLYLTEGGRFGFVLPGSAVIAQTWQVWRVGNWGAATVRFDLHETYDDMSDPPFPHAPNGACIVSGSRNTSSQDPGDWTKAEPLRVSGTPALIRTVRWVQRAPQPSPYATRFTRGAVASPLGLVLVVTPPAPGPYTGTVKVTTMASTKGKWKGVQYSNVIVEKACLLPALRSQTLRPFVCEPDAWFIAPHAENMGKFRILELDDPKFPERYGHGLEYWRRAEETYAQHRAKTAGETLSQNLDRYRTLTKQLGTDFEPGAAEDPPYSKVFYNKSGNTLRACRGSRNLLADDKLYWYVASDPSEALYLCAVLNAEWTQEAWRESKTSKMHYDLNPLKHVPVPLYDRSDPLHANIVRLAREAEQSPDASRDSLEQEVARLLPEWGPIH
ncbi:MAG: hypothetical protein OXH33_00225 [bacterium]|nr:hypothetical protein [bacterium]